MDLGEFYKKHKQYYYWKLSRKINGMGLAFHAEDVIHDVVVSMIADENCLAKFEHLTEPEAKAYFTACLTHRMIDIIRREKRHREYLETVECYEKKLKTESCSAETIVVEQLDFELVMRKAICVLADNVCCIADQLRILIFLNRKVAICLL